MSNKSQPSSKNRKSVDKNEELLHIRQEMLAKEVDEELQKERILTIWNKYKFLIIGGIIVLVGAGIIYEWYQGYMQKVRTAESNQFEEARLRSEVAQNQEEEQAVLALFHQLGIEAQTGYRYLAQLNEADTLFEQNQKEAALDVLKGMMSDSKAPDVFRDMARLRSVIYRGYDSDTNTLLNELSPLLNPQNPYYPAAAELAAALYLKENNPQEAVQTLKQVLNTRPDLNERQKQRFEDYISLIEQE